MRVKIRPMAAGIATVVLISLPVQHSEALGLFVLALFAISIEIRFGGR